METAHRWQTWTNLFIVAFLASLFLAHPPVASLGSHPPAAVAGNARLFFGIWAAQTLILLSGLVGSGVGLVWEKRRLRRAAESPPLSLVAPLPPGATMETTSETVNPWESRGVGAAATETAPVAVPDFARLPHRAFPYQMTRPAFDQLWWDVYVRQRPRERFIPPCLTAAVFVLPLVQNGKPLTYLAAMVGIYLFSLWVDREQVRRNGDTSYNLFPTRHDKNSVYLTSTGMYDTMPSNVFFVAWEDVTAIRRKGGVLRVDTRVNEGCHFPTESFEGGKATAKAFYQAAHTLWKTNGAEWPGDVLPVLPEENAASSAKK